MSNNNCVPEKVIFLSFGVGFLAILSNAIYLLFKLFFALSENGNSSFLFGDGRFVLLYVNILTGILYVYLGYSLFSKRRWAIHLYQRVGYLVFVPVFVIVYIVDPLLVKYGLGPAFF